jgi:hypothetical protein
MIFTFYMREATANALRSSRDKRASSFRGLHVSFYDTNLGLVGGDNADPAAPRQSSPSWLSWIAPQRNSNQSRSPDGDRGRPRSEEEAERGVDSKQGRPSVPDDVLSSSFNSSATDVITRGISEGFSSPTVPLPTGTNGKSSIPTAAAMTTAPDSPTLPPDGIRETQAINRFRTANPSSDGSMASSQLTGFDNLLREQNELEKSIAALRAMFSPGRGGEPLRGASPDTVSDHPERNRFRESSTTGYGPTSASGRSDFSLSVFPQPPQVPLLADSLRRNDLRSTAATPTQATYSIGEQVLPISTTDGDNVADSAPGRRTESAGTQYDVTSFIGGVPAVFFLSGRLSLNFLS